MAILGPYAIQQIAVNPSTWTPIITPFSCASFSIRCDSDIMYERTDPSDPSTEDVVPASSQEYVLGHTHHWAPGETILWVKSKTLSTTLIAKFVGVFLVER